MRRLPLLPVAPLLVVLIGLAAAATIVTIGLGQIQRTSDAEAQHRAVAVSTALAARLRLTALEDRGPLIADIAQREDVELLIVAQDGQAMANASFESFDNRRVVDMLVDGQGTIETSNGRQRF